MASNYEILTQFEVKKDGLVSHGIPLPRNKVYDINKLCILNKNGDRIFCQFRELNKWYPSKSIANVLMSFKGNVGTYTLVILEDKNEVQSFQTQHAVLFVNLVKDQKIVTYIKDKLGRLHIAKTGKFQVIEDGFKTLIKYDWKYQDDNDINFLWGTMYVTTWQGIGAIQLDFFLKNSYGILGDALGNPEINEWVLTTNLPLAECRWTSETLREVSKGPAGYQFKLLSNDYIEDMQHNGVRLYIGEIQQDFDLIKQWVPISIPRAYLKFCRVGDFEYITSDDKSWYNYKPSSEVHYSPWHYGQPYGSTHTVGFPYIGLPYGLPYWLTAQEDAWDNLDKFSWYGMSVRPFHIATYDGFYQISPKDRLPEGAFDQSDPGNQPGGDSRRSAVQNHASLQWTGTKHGINGMDYEHYQIDDLWWRYLIDGHPKAIESIKEFLECVLTIDVHKYDHYVIHSGRTLGFALRVLCQGYQLLGDERYWNVCNRLIDSLYWWSGWKRLPNSTKDYGRGTNWVSCYNFNNSGITKSIINWGDAYPGWSEFKPWMSAIGIWGITQYILLALWRQKNGLNPGPYLETISNIVLQTAEMTSLCIDNEGIFYQVDIYQNPWKSYDDQPGTWGGTGFWNSITFAVAYFLSNKKSRKYLDLMYKIIDRKYKDEGQDMFTDRVMQLALIVDNQLGDKKYEKDFTVKREKDTGTGK